MGVPTYRCPFKNNAGNGLTCENVLCGAYNDTLQDCNIIMTFRRQSQLLGNATGIFDRYSSSSSSSSSSSLSSSSTSSSSSSSSFSSSSSSSSSQSSSSSSNSSSSSSSSSASGYGGNP